MRGALRGRATATLTVICLGAAACPRPARAGLADTVPPGVVIIDSSYINTETNRRLDNDGKRQNLADDVERFAPTGEFQGRITVPGEHEVDALLSRVAVGVTDWLTLGVVIPYFFKQETRLNLGWEPGDFIPEFNRQMSEDDFWDWALGLGQPKPQDWVGENRLGDVILAALVNLVREDWVQLTVMGFGSTFTSEKAPAEELGSVGTSGFDFITNGDIGGHLLTDLRMPESQLLRHFTLSTDLFYEHFLERTFKAPRGQIHPLILNYAPFLGDTYKVQRGDIYGGAVALTYDVIPGPTETSWLTRSNPELQQKLPSAFSLFGKYTHFHAYDTDYISPSLVWNSDQEEDNLELYKNIVSLGGRLSLIRYGIPLDIDGEYTAQTWLPGKNFRPADGFRVGVRLYYSVFINPFDLF